MVHNTLKLHVVSPMRENVKFLVEVVNVARKKSQDQESALNKGDDVIGTTHGKRFPLLN